MSFAAFTPTDDTPPAIPTVNTSAGSSVLLDVLANDGTDAELLDVPSQSTGAQSLSITEGKVRYAFSANSVGTDTFTYRVRPKAQIRVDTNLAAASAAQDAVSPSTLSLQNTQWGPVAGDTDYIGLEVPLDLSNVIECSAARYTISVTWTAQKTTGAHVVTGKEAGVVFGSAAQRPQPNQSLPAANGGFWYDGGVSSAERQQVIFEGSNAINYLLPSTELLRDVRIGFFLRYSEQFTVSRTYHYWRSLHARIGIVSDTSACAPTTRSVTLLRSPDTDGDGITDNIDGDDDNDFIADSVDGESDVDGDGLVARLDVDADGDRIPDAIEAGAAAQNVNATSGRYQDSSGNYPQSVSANLNPAARDTDNDGTPDYLDSDSDGDGLSDRIESVAFPIQSNSGYVIAPLDTDNDGHADYRDLDSDDDSIPDAVESGASVASSGTSGLSTATLVYLDSDGDRVPNARDLDSDDDGLRDLHEANCAIVSNALICSFETDAERMTSADANADGWRGDDAAYRTSAGRLVDSDNDSSRNFLDKDSDGDGLFDTDESGRRTSSGGDLDINRDGRVDSSLTDQINGVAVNMGALQIATLKDLNGDRLPSYLQVENILADADKDGIPDAEESTNDADGDGTPDYQDTDADGDGVPDAIESGAAANDVTAFGVYKPARDRGETVPDADRDSDGDGVPNRLDLDSDADGLADRVESRANADTAGSTLQLQPVDSDGDGIVDMLDLDADDDGIQDTAEERLADAAPADGKVDIRGTLHQSALDSDADGVPNYRDLDSDNDGLNDLFEGACTVSTTSLVTGGSLVCYENVGVEPGTLRLTGADGNTNGWRAPFDGRGSLQIPDTDTDTLPNFLDLDSDADGRFDTQESTRGADDSDNNGMLNNPDSTTGIPSASSAVSRAQLPDSDNDGRPAHLDSNEGAGDATTTATSAATSGDALAIKTGLSGNGSLSYWFLLLVGALILRRKYPDLLIRTH